MIAPPSGRVANIAHPEDVLNTINKITHILCTVVMTAFVLTRVYAKWKIFPPFALDDWCCIITYFLSLGHIATAFGMCYCVPRNPLRPCPADRTGHQVWDSVVAASICGRSHQNST